MERLHCPQLCSVPLRWFRSSPRHRPSRARVFSGFGVGPSALSRTSHPSGSRRWRHPMSGSVPAPGTVCPRKPLVPYGVQPKRSQIPWLRHRATPLLAPRRGVSAPAPSVRDVAEGMCKKIGTDLFLYRWRDKSRPYTRTEWAWFDGLTTNGFGFPSPFPLPQGARE